MYFTADEHYGHGNIIKYCNRPFASIEEMNHIMIDNHNSVVKEKDVVYHLGDFTLNKAGYASDIIKQLNGVHVFVRGSHDKWLGNTPTSYIIEKMFDGLYIVMCHYALRVWPRSHYGSVQLYGHSHGNLPAVGKQMDVGVDCNNFYPVSLENIKKKFLDFPHL